MISKSTSKNIYTMIALSLVLFSQQLFAENRKYSVTPLPAQGSSTTNSWGITATQSSTQYTTLTSNAQRGRWIWLKNNCMGCHGDNGGGGMGPNVKHAEISDIHEVVSGGEGGMPSYLKITATDITMLTEYLASIDTPSEPKFICWWKYPINDLGYSGVGARPNCNP
jgi:mono/diheme cytochrome c family protein